MSSNLSVIQNRLAQTTYNLDTNTFVNRRQVKPSDAVKSQFGKFASAYIGWTSTDKSGSTIVSTGLFRILLVQSNATADYATMFATTQSTIERFQADCTNFVLELTDFVSLFPVGVQRYYLVKSNHLEILEVESANNQLDLNLMCIGKEVARMKVNSFLLVDGAQADLTATDDGDAGVCKCDYSCATKNCRCRNC